MSEIVAEHGTRRRGAPAAPSAGLGLAATDLAFSDLVLWVLDRDPDVFWAAAQIRPDYADIGALVRGHGSCRVQ